MRRRLALALALMLTACAGAETATTSAPTTTSTTSIAVTTSAEPTTSTSTVDPSGTIVVAESAHEIGVQMTGNPTPFSLNPLIAEGWGLLGDLRPLLFAGAWKPGPDGEPRADLVTALPHPDDATAVVAPDGLLRLTYRIRPDARWDDGTPVTSADFETTLRILQDPELPIVADMRDMHATVSTFESASSQEFSVSLAPPFTMYRHLFPVVVPSHVVDTATFATDWVETAWSSAGPMRLVSFEQSQAPIAGVMTFEANPAHPNAPVVGLRIDFYQRDDHGDSLAIPAFLRGEADILGSDAFDWWRRDEIAELASVVPAPPAIWEALFIQPGAQRLQVNPDSGVDLQSTRRAINAALLGPQTDSLPGDRITSLTEYFLPGVDGPDAWGSTLLGPAVIGPVPLVYESTNGDITVQIGQAIEPLLEEAGFAVELRFAGDAQAAFIRFGDGDFETFAIRLVRQPGSVALFELLRVLTGDDDWFPDVWPDEASRSAFRTALDGFAAEPDPDARIDHLIDAELALVGAMTVIPLVTREGEHWAYHPDRVTGPTAYDGEGFYSTISSWRRP